MASVELARVEALIERWANWLIQGRDGSDAEGAEAAWIYLKELERQRAELLQNEEPG